ncbi:hypothetical protein LTR62_007588 [Meristemomyces frigidus]|uniref:Uncharacterized protein n=1 Tax=Meristemomyces frigidus TaxID=1508187 RepID=A0AAN7TAR3_9PEZI|nr:hypothetical protein LTR62_007588 [Meristemomyces frigidus]
MQSHQLQYVNINFIISFNLNFNFDLDLDLNPGINFNFNFHINLHINIHINNNAADMASEIHWPNCYLMYLAPELRLIIYDALIDPTPLPANIYISAEGEWYINKASRYLGTTGVDAVALMKCSRQLYKEVTPALRGQLIIKVFLFDALVGWDAEGVKFKDVIDLVLRKPVGWVIVLCKFRNQAEKGAAIQKYQALLSGVLASQRKPSHRKHGIAEQGPKLLPHEAAGRAAPANIRRSVGGKAAKDNVYLQICHWRILRRTKLGGSGTGGDAVDLMKCSRQLDKEMGPVLRGRLDFYVSLQFEARPAYRRDLYSVSDMIFRMPIGKIHVGVYQRDPADADDVVRACNNLSALLAHQENVVFFHLGHGTLLRPELAERN